jgi:hypothetical protein
MQNFGFSRRCECIVRYWIVAPLVFWLYTKVSGNTLLPSSVIKMEAVPLVCYAMHTNISEHAAIFRAEHGGSSSGLLRRVVSWLYTNVLQEYTAIFRAEDGSSMFLRKCIQPKTTQRNNPNDHQLHPRPADDLSGSCTFFCNTVSLCVMKNG